MKLVICKKILSFGKLCSRSHGVAVFLLFFSENSQTYRTLNTPNEKNTKTWMKTHWICYFQHVIMGNSPMIYAITHNFFWSLSMWRWICFWIFWFSYIFLYFLCFPIGGGTIYAKFPGKNNFFFLTCDGEWLFVWKTCECVWHQLRYVRKGVLH